jgi:hypothetical protein
MNEYRMDPNYRLAVRDKVRANQRKKIAAEGSPELFNTPSAHVRNQMIPFKDRRDVLPGMDTQQTRRVEGGRYSGGAAGHSSGSKIQTGGMYGLAKPRKVGGRAVAGAGRAQSGGNFFKDLKKAVPIAANIARKTAKYGIPAAAGVLGAMEGGPVGALAAAKAAKEGVNVVGLGASKQKKRGALVSKLMKEQKMTLGQASKHIKENNLL